MSLGITLRQLRRTDAFATLPRRPWLAFIAIACHWQGGAGVWPNQETIARFSGYTARAVRDALGELERRSLVQVRRRRDARGFERIDYAPGPGTLAALQVLRRSSSRTERMEATSGPVEDGSDLRITAGSPPDGGTTALGLTRATIAWHEQESAS